MRGTPQLLTLLELAQSRLTDPRNARKGDWKRSPLGFLVWMLIVEIAELFWEFVKLRWYATDHKAAEQYNQTLANIKHESGDVVNCIMFILDKLGLLKEEK